MAPSLICAHPQCHTHPPTMSHTHTHNVTHTHIRNVTHAHARPRCHTLFFERPSSPQAQRSFLACAPCLSCLCLSLLPCRFLSSELWFSAVDPMGSHYVWSPCKKHTRTPTMSNSWSSSSLSSLRTSDWNWRCPSGPAPTFTCIQNHSQ